MTSSVEYGLSGFRGTWSAPYARTPGYGEIAGTVVLLLAAWLLIGPIPARTTNTQDAPDKTWQIRPLTLNR